MDRDLFESPDQAVVRATVQKARAIIDDFGRRMDAIAECKQRIEALEAEAEALRLQYQKCMTTAELFGFDLGEECDKAAHVGFREDWQPGTLSAPAANPLAHGVKAFVLAQVEAAYPHAMKAADIRKRLSEHGVEVHEKTVGMTLYRLSKQGEVTRSGTNWYFIPPDQRNVQHEVQEYLG